MPTKIKELLIIFFATILVSVLIWLPHLLRLQSFYYLDFSQGINTIYKNYDGLEYVVIAKTFYQPDLISNLQQLLPVNYYASHFPGYPIFILLFAQFFGYLKSMIFVSTIFTGGSALIFYLLLKDFHLTQKPLLLSLIFLVIPARWLVVHSVGSSEPMFIFFILTSIYFFMKFEEDYNSKLIWFSGLFGLMAQVTRPPGILLFIAYAIYIHWKMLPDIKTWNIKNITDTHMKYYPLILIPAGLFLIFYLYAITYQDFFAYFHSGDNIHLSLIPFQVFNKVQFWVGEIWLEDIIYILILGFLAGFLLIKKNLKLLGIFVLTYMVASSLVVHRDISRYTLPIVPFVLIAFEKILISKEFKIILGILLLGIYLYAQNFILNNTAPLGNLQIFN